MVVRVVKMPKSRLRAGTTACEHVRVGAVWELCTNRKTMADSAFRMKNMIQARNSKNIWHVSCVAIIVSDFFYFSIFSIFWGF